MKKVKLMLMSLSVLAVVGGALAFKAKTGTQFCTAPTTSSTACPAFCSTVAKLKTTTDRSIYFCTTPTSGNPSDPCNGSTGLACDLTTPLNTSTIE